MDRSRFDSKIAAEVRLPSIAVLRKTTTPVDASSPAGP